MRSGALAVGLAAAFLAPEARAQRIAEPPPIQAARAPDRLPYAPGVDVLHYDLEIGVSDRTPRLAGRATLRVLATADAPLLPLDLTGLAVDGVLMDGVECPAELRDGVLRVALDGAHAGDTVEVTVAYGGTPDDGLHLGPTLHGTPSAFADNWPNRARFWFPSVDHPSDKATVRFAVHAPALWQVVANGALQGDPGPTPAEALGPPSGDRRTWVWESRVPIPTYTMVFGAGELVTRPVDRAACGQAPASVEPDGCVEVTWWAFPPDTLAAERIFRRAPQMVDVFTGMVGPFPYEKLAHVQSATRFGGMENSSAIFYSASAISSGLLSERTVAHETAHQWFGDAVTEAEWSHVWLSEGFATYFAALFYEAIGEKDAFARHLEDSRRDVLASPLIGRPVVASTPDLYDVLSAMTYDKGAWVLHMLRDVVGDEAFFAGIRTYYARHRHGTALTDDLRAVMEEASGQPLEWFFRQWLYEPGIPVLEVRHGWADGELEVSIRQIQPESWPRFRLPVDLALGGPSGPRTRVWLDGSETVVRIPADAPPRRVLLDPDRRVLTADVRYR